MSALIQGAGPGTGVRGVIRPCPVLSWHPRAGPRGPLREGGHGATSAPRGVKSEGRRGGGLPRRGGAEPAPPLLRVLLLAFLPLGSCAPNCTSFQTRAPAEMFNRAVSRLSRKRPPSGKLLPGPEGWGLWRPEGLEESWGILPSLLDSGAAGRCRPDENPGRPRHFSRRGPAFLWFQQPWERRAREASRGGILAERRNSNSFLF